MDTQQVIRFSYTQSLSSDGERWSETVEAQVVLSSAALSTGWLKENFTGRKGGALDYIVLTAIIMHARPLKGDDLALFGRLGLATPEDEGRLYARVSDIGLADELGVHRKTIAASARRLAEAGFIAVLDLPDGFRDSRGRFAGSKAYLVSGEMERYLPKVIENTRGSLSATDEEEAPHRGSSSTTDTPDRGTLTATVSPENASTVAVKVPHRGSLTATNINDDEDEEEEEEGFLEKIAAERVFARFAVLLGRDYAPTQKDRQLLAQLDKAGYCTADVLAGMERVKDNLGGAMDGVQSFAYVIPEIRRQPPTAPENASSAPEEKPPANPPDSGGNPQALGAAVPPENQPLEPPAVEVPAEIERVFRAVMRREMTPVERQRLVWLHEELSSAAETGPEAVWKRILDAMKFQLNPFARNPIPYLHKLLTQPEKPDAGSGKKQRLHKKPGDQGTALAKTDDVEYPPVQFGAITITRPPERKSGYVIPAEETRRGIYDAIMAIRALERQMQLDDETDGGDDRG